MTLTIDSYSFFSYDSHEIKVQALYIKKVAYSSIFSILKYTMYGMGICFNSFLPKIFNPSVLVKSSSLKKPTFSILIPVNL